MGCAHLVLSEVVQHCEGLMRQVIKILIIGSANLDQRVYIRTIRDEISPRRLKRAAPGAFDNFGELQVDDALCIQMYGMSASDVISAAQSSREVLSESSLGVVEVVDCTIGGTFADARAVIAYFHGQEHLPCVVAVHRFEQPGAASLQEIRTAMGVDNSVNIIPCDVTQEESAKGVLLALAEAILQKMG